MRLPVISHWYLLGLRAIARITYFPHGHRYELERIFMKEDGDEAQSIYGAAVSY